MRSTYRVLMGLELHFKICITTKKCVRSIIDWAVYFYGCLVAIEIDIQKTTYILALTSHCV